MISTVGSLTDSEGNQLNYLVETDSQTFINEGRILRNIFGDSYEGYNIVSATSEQGANVVVNSTSIRYDRGSFRGEDEVTLGIVGPDGTTYTYTVDFLSLDADNELFTDNRPVSGGEVAFDLYSDYPTLSGDTFDQFFTDKVGDDIEITLHAVRAGGDNYIDFTEVNGDYVIDAASVGTTFLLYDIDVYDASSGTTFRTTVASNFGPAPEGYVPPTPTPDPIDVTGNSFFYTQTDVASFDNAFEKNIFEADGVAQQLGENLSLTGPLTFVSAEAQNGSFEIGAGGLAVDYNSPSTAGAEVATFTFQDEAGNQETISITFNVSEAPAITLDTSAEALQGVLLNRDNLSGGGNISESTGFTYGAQIGAVSNDTDFAANYELLTGSPLDVSNQVDVLAKYDGSGTYTVSEDELLSLYTTTAGSSLSVNMEDSSKYDFTYDAATREFTFTNITTFDGGFELRYRVGDELGNSSVSQKLAVFEETGPAIQAGVEGEDYIYGNVQLNDTNNNWGKRGFNEAGDYWVKVKNQTDDPLIGNGQEIALVMGSSDTIFGTNVQTEDILTGLQEGTLISTKSWTSYDGTFNIAAFDGAEVQGLMESGDTLRITRVDATTGEQIGGSQLFDETLMYTGFDQNYNNSLSAQNDFNYAEIIAAANVDPII